MKTSAHPSACTKITRSGFSLVEVLIAILVLAIGMLGLGAIFPAVIAEQRNAFEVIEGENVAKAAEGLISSNREFVDFSLISSDFNRRAVGEPYVYEWIVPQDGSSFYSFNTPIPAFDFGNGTWSYNSNDSTVNPLISLVNTNPELAQIPVSARLFPSPYSGEDPKYVWDLALRRQPGGNHLQAAVFVRRVDARLRIPRGFSLSDVLTDGGQNNLPDGALLPVAIDFTNGSAVADDGGPTKVYAAIQTLEVEVHPEHLDWLVFKNGRNPGIDTSVGFAAKIGQKLLDNTGVVRTVVGLPTVASGDSLESERVVLVDPPFTFQNAGGGQTDTIRPDRTLPDNDQYKRASWVRQVIFTPRTPVAIRLVTLEESP